jgi:hypothetical protein
VQYDEWFSIHCGDPSEAGSMGGGRAQVGEGEGEGEGEDEAPPTGSTLQAASQPLFMPTLQPVSTTLGQHVGHAHCSFAC